MFQLPSITDPQPTTESSTKQVRCQQRATNHNTQANAQPTIPADTTNTTQPQRTTKIIPVIIDNITITHTPQDTENNIHAQFANITIASIEFLKRGGICITSVDPHGVNSLLDPDKWDKEYFGSDLYIHPASDHIDVRPWYCINKVPSGLDLNTIKEEIGKIRPP